MRVIADFSVVPIGAGVSVSRFVAACHDVLDEAGLACRLHAQGTNVEGEWVEGFAAIKRCHERVHAMGAPRVSTVLKGGTRRDRPEPMAEKGERVVEGRGADVPAGLVIGRSSATGAACRLDRIAMAGREDEIRLIEAGGDQRSAYEYGSAFSRAAVAPMPTGKSVFISGTAAIDPQGRTEHIGEIETQIDDTISHIRSLLRQLDCTDASVLTSLAYCKTPVVEQVFRERWPDLTWPHLTMNGEVCRPELLFEVEVTARPVTEGKVEKA